MFKKLNFYFVSSFHHLFLYFGLKRRTGKKWMSPAETV